MRVALQQHLVRMAKKSPSVGALPIDLADGGHRHAEVFASMKQLTPVDEADGYFLG